MDKPTESMKNPPMRTNRLVPNGRNGQALNHGGGAKGRRRKGWDFPTLLYGPMLAAARAKVVRTAAGMAAGVVPGDPPRCHASADSSCQQGLYTCLAACLGNEDPLLGKNESNKHNK
jgi:hypothetical protein